MILTTSTSSICIIVHSILSGTPFAYQCSALLDAYGLPCSSILSAVCREALVSSFNQVNHNERTSAHVSGAQAARGGGIEAIEHGFIMATGWSSSSGQWMLPGCKPTNLLRIIKSLLSEESRMMGLSGCRKPGLYSGQGPMRKEGRTLIGMTSPSPLTIPSLQYRLHLVR